MGTGGQLPVLQHSRDADWQHLPATASPAATITTFASATAAIADASAAVATVAKASAIAAATLTTAAAAALAPTLAVTAALAATTAAAAAVAAAHPCGRLGAAQGCVVSSISHRARQLACDGAAVWRQLGGRGV